tara:strand:- start:6 stop:308 length:303 start_codon:yes stop_codon:yes gene_type:complete
VVELEEVINLEFLMVETEELVDLVVELVVEVEADLLQEEMLDLVIIHPQLPLKVILEVVMLVFLLEMQKELVEEELELQVVQLDLVLVLVEQVEMERVQI